VNPTLATVIGVEATRVDNAMIFDNLPSEVALEESEIRSTDPDVLINITCTENQVCLRMAGGSKQYEGEGDESNRLDEISTPSWRLWERTQRETFDLECSGVSMDDGENCYDAD
jgi:hypothetical protein